MLQRVQQTMGGCIIAVCVMVMSASVAGARDSASPKAAHSIDAAAKTLILIDASGDMKAGVAKFDLQRQALQAAAVAPENISMAAYGGQACGGFAQLAGGSVEAAMQSVKPAGRRNLAAALDAAYAEIALDKQRNRILAIVGGPNQCLAALCAHAVRLKARTPEVVVDIIGFGLTDTAARRLDCVAANTGGRFTRADDASLASSLSLALGPSSKLFADVAELDIPDPVRAQAEISRQAPPVIVARASAFDMTGPELSLPRGLRLSAALKAGAPVLEAGVRFELFRKDPEGILRLVARTERTSSPLFAVPSGSYIARIQTGNVVRDSQVKVPEDGILNERIALNAGQIILTAAIANRPVNQRARFDLQRLDAPGASITIVSRGQALTTVKPGRYRVTATIEAASASTEVSILPGAVARAFVDVPIGFLRVVTLSGIDDLKVMRGDVLTARADGGGMFRLSPGQYRIVAGKGEAVIEANAIVKVGHVASVELDGDDAQIAANVHARPILIAQQPSMAPKVNRR
jgi:hypothetical protein